MPSNSGRLDARLALARHLQRHDPSFEPSILPHKCCRRGNTGPWRCNTWRACRLAILPALRSTSVLVGSLGICVQQMFCPPPRPPLPSVGGEEKSAPRTCACLDGGLHALCSVLVHIAELATCSSFDDKGKASVPSCSRVPNLNKAGIVRLVQAGGVSREVITAWSRQRLAGNRLIRVLKLGDIRCDDTECSIPDNSLESLGTAPCLGRGRCLVIRMCASSM